MHMGTRYRYTCAHTCTHMHTHSVPGHMDCTFVDTKVLHSLSPLNVAGWVAESPPACFVEPKADL